MDTTEPREPIPRKRRRHAKASLAPTLRDVARAASVSTASVSRALSRPDLVSEELRGRVRAAVHTLAYVPNAAAQALSGRPERLVGAVVTTLGDPPTMLTLEALSLELAKHGAALLTAVAGDGEAGVAACTRGLLARGAEAIVFGGGATPVDPGRNQPWASLDEPVSRLAPGGSGFDYAGALALVARYLHGLGHVRIGLLGVGGGHRSDAVRHALGDTGIQIVEDAFAGKAWTDGGLGDVFDQWRTLPAPPTAVACGSDRVAVAVLQECKRQDIPVPGQLSVVGYGDTELSRQVRPALSTVRVPAGEAGAALARSLLAQLDARFEPSPELHPKLVVRESTGARP